MRVVLLLAGLLCALAAFRPVFLSENTVLQGKITDDQGEALIGATVRILRGADLVRGLVTDHNGEFRVQLEPGAYDFEAAYTGYQTNRTTGVQVLAGQVNTLNLALSAGAVLSEIVVTAPKAPPIEQDKTSGGQTLTSEDIKHLPTRSVNAIVATTAGAASGREKKAKDSRAPATNYYVDGARAQTAAPAQKQYARADMPAELAQEDEARRKLAGCQPGDTIRPDDDSAEQYNSIVENPFLETAGNPLSTFSIDVDVAAYANLRRYINYGQLPPADAVRIEEMINYFDYRYAAPTDGHPFAVHTELAPCPWQPKHQLLLINLQGQNIDVGQLPASNLVFLVDVSGSMNEPDKLPLVKQSLELLTDQLRPQDRVAIVVYAGAAGLVLPPTSGADKATIKTALQQLEAGGSTAGGAGIQLAYKTARENFMNGGNNRVILCTDGDFNVGVSNENELVKMIEKERESGVFLTVLGYGTGNYQDGKMQSLADKGNGNHAYIDQIGEAKKVLVREFGGTLFAIAKDVKLQLEFNPAKVGGYRLIGYENRLLAKEDFNDDTKDAGELGAGHRVTALYEIVPAGEPMPFAASTDPLKYQFPPLVTLPTTGDELLTLKFRYKPPRGNQPSRLIEVAVPASVTARPSENFLLASSVAEFGLLLRDSKYKGNASWSHLGPRAQQAAAKDPTGYRREFAELVEKARRLAEPVTAKK